MKILLVNPPCGPRTFGMRYISRVEPLGLEYIGGAVSDRHEVRLVDMMVRPGDLPRTLKTFRPDVVGVTAEAARWETSLAVLRAVRRIAPDCLTVVGGHHATLYPHDYDDPAVDLVVQGEGVDTFREICAARAAGASSFEHIAGLLVRTEFGLKPTDPRPSPTSLEHYPLPDRTLTAAYRRWYYYLTEPHVGGVRISFGCPYGCSFCPSKLYCQSHFVMRDPQRVFDEICTIREPMVMICDTGSFHDVERMTRLAQLLINRGVRKRFYSYARADNVVRHPELFELWRRAGLSIAMIGLEALDEESLQKYNKQSSTSTNERAVQILGDLGVEVTGGFLVEPDAGPEYFDRVDRYIASHPAILHAEFTPLTPFPGTRYYEEVKDTVLTTDWQVYDMQHFVVKTRVPAEVLYRRMAESYRKIIYRVVWRDKLWLPLVGIRKRKPRLLLGLMANARALKNAHRHVLECPSPADQLQTKHQEQQEGNHRRVLVGGGLQAATRPPHPA